MVSILLGENSSGKTVMLERKRKELAGKPVITNLCPSLIYHNDDYDSDKIEVLSTIIHYDIKGTNKSLLDLPVFTEKTSLEFIDLLTILCKKGDYLLLDTPEHGLYSYEFDVVMELLCRTSLLYKEVYIVSHDELIRWFPNAKFYSVEKIDSDFQLKEISWEKTKGYFDSI